VYIARMGRRCIRISYWWESQKEREHQEDHDLSGRIIIEDRLCGLVDRVPSYRPRGWGSIPGITRFSEK
jgi:hypothetical protein